MAKHSATSSSASRAHLCFGRSATCAEPKRCRKRQEPSPSTAYACRLADVPREPLIARFLREPLGVLTRQKALSVEVVGQHVSPFGSVVGLRSVCTAVALRRRSPSRCPWGSETRFAVGERRRRGHR